MFDVLNDLGVRLATGELVAVLVATVATILASHGTWARSTVERRAVHEVGHYPRRDHRRLIALHRLILLVPGVVVAIVFGIRGRLGDIGLQIGDSERGLRTLGVAAGAAAVIFLVALWIERSRDEEAMVTWGWGDHFTYGLIETVSSGLLLRGYLLGVLAAAHTGMAILVVAALDGVLASTSRTIGGALVGYAAGLVLAGIVLATDSVFYSIAVHWLFLGIFARFPAEPLPYGVERPA